MRRAGSVVASRTPGWALALAALPLVLPPMLACSYGGPVRKPPPHTDFRQLLTSLRHIRRTRGPSSPATVSISRENRTDAHAVFKRRNVSSKGFLHWKRKLRDRATASLHCPSSFASGTARSSSSTSSFLCSPFPSLSSSSSSSPSSWSSAPLPPFSFRSVYPPSPALPPFRLFGSSRSLSLAPSSSSPAPLPASSKSSTYVALHRSRSPSCISSLSLARYPPSPRMPSQRSQDLPYPSSSQRSIPSSSRKQVSDSLLPSCVRYTRAPLRRLSFPTGYDSSFETAVQVFAEAPHASLGKRVKAIDARKTRLFTSEVGYSSLWEKRQAKMLASLFSNRTRDFVNHSVSTLADEFNTTVKLNRETHHETSISKEKGESKKPFSNNRDLQPASVKAQMRPNFFSPLAIGEKVALENSTKPLSALIYSPDLQKAQYRQLELWLSIATTGIFNEVVWGCPGPSAYVDSSGSRSANAPTVACALLRDAEFCVANYLLLESLNGVRGYKRANWSRRDGSDAGLEAATKLCEVEVFDWGRETVANCERAMSNMKLQFPPDQCL